MKKEIIVYEDIAMVTIKHPDTKELIFRFTKWKNREFLEEVVNTKRIFSIQDETFPSRNFEKLEKFNGEFPSNKILGIVQKKIQKYRSTFYTNPPQGVLRKMTENAKKELTNQSCKNQESHPTSDISDTKQANPQFSERSGESNFVRVTTDTFRRVLKPSKSGTHTQSKKN